MSEQSFLLPYGKRMLLEHLDKLPTGYKWDVIIKPHIRKRSVNQNSLAHAWYAQISRTLKEDTPEGVKRECKLLYGIPIIRADDEELNVLFSKGLDPLSYENQLLAMRVIDVTSLMTTVQTLEYMAAVQRAYAGRVDLRYPNEPPMVAA